MAKKHPKLSSILKNLLFQRDMKPVDLARAVNLPVPTVHRIVTGRSTRPYDSSLIPIAEFFGVTTEELVGMDPLIPENSKAHHPSSDTSSEFQTIPLSGWESLNLEKEQQKPEARIAVGKMSSESFAVYMPDFSMQPLFEKGCILIFDPEAKPIDRSYVLVKNISTGTHVFRQLIIDGDHQYIRAINSDISISNIRPLTSEDIIIARLVETRSNFQ